MAQNQAASIIEKWYLALGFPKEYDKAFYQALADYTIDDSVSIDNYDLSCQDGKMNLLSVLYMCEALEQNYQARNISRDILLDTLQDIVRYTVIWSNIKETLYLGELEWLKFHLQGALVKLGRIQFKLTSTPQAFPEAGILEPEYMMELHIPDEGPLTPEAVDASIRAADVFFPKDTFRYFTCRSWLLDPTLKDFLKPSSNILAFQNRFQIVAALPSDGLLRYLFQWNTTRENLAQFIPSSPLAAKVQESALAGRTFYAGTGILKR